MKESWKDWGKRRHLPIAHISVILKSSLGSIGKDAYAKDGKVGEDANYEEDSGITGKC